jgi:hypothetical protein
LAEIPKKDPSAIILPFGKHKGKTVAELLAVDPQYADWVSAQAWVAERFAELHSAIVSRGAGVDDSPEHNAIQGRFLDQAFREGFFDVIYDRAASLALATENVVIRLQEGMTWRYGATDERREKCRGILERIALGESPELRTGASYEVKGVDVRFWYRWTIGGLDDGYNPIGLEIKPTLGDDYPSVMRQMKRLEVNYLVVGTYTGRGVSEPQMREMFRMSDITVVFVQEIEEAMRQANTPEWW